MDTLVLLTATSIASICMGMLFWLMLVLLLPFVLWVFAAALVFQKAGRAWWEALVPIYSDYVLATMAGKPWWWVFLLVIPGIGTIFKFLVYLALGKCFKLDWPFAVGLTLLPMIFYPILAWGPYRYEEPIMAAEAEVQY